MARPRWESAACTGAHCRGHGSRRVRRVAPSFDANRGPTQLAVLQAPQLAHLPFGQLLVINPDHLAKRRERLLIMWALASTSLSRWAL